MTLYELSPSLYWLMVAMWGLVLGSFTTCVLYRVPRGISLWRQPDGSYRSFCPSCHTELRPIDLIPVFSWALQRGRCRYCGVKFGAFYPMVEVLVLIGTLLLAFGLQESSWLFAAAFIIPLMTGIFGLIKRFWKI
jgi:leader peptidase (prepilin peptidase)/N-methyltransferase